MPELSQKDLSSMLKKSAASLCGSFLFCGEEEYLKRRAAENLRGALFPDAAMLPFGRIRLSGEGKSPEELFSLARDELLSLPMFGVTKLVELHSLSLDKFGEEDLESLLQLLSMPGEGTILLLYSLFSEFDPGTPPKRPSGLWKKLCGSSARVVLFSRETPARLAVWIQKHFAAAGLLCDPGTARALIDYCSPDMSTLAEETEKLICYHLAGGKTKVSPEAIPFVCRPRYLDGNFAFTNAILSGRVEESMRLLAEQKRRKERPELLLSGIADCVAGMVNCRMLSDGGMQKQEIAAATGLHEYRVGLFLNAARSYRPGILRKALDVCAKTDVRLKSTGGDRYLPLEILILRLAGSAGMGQRD